MPFFYEKSNMRIRIHGRAALLASPQKCPKSLGPKPPKAEKPSGIPKIRKLATLKQYEFLNGIPPGFSPAERFFRQRPWSTELLGGSGTQPYIAHLLCDKSRLVSEQNYSLSRMKKAIVLIAATASFKYEY